MSGLADELLADLEGLSDGEEEYEDQNQLRGLLLKAVHLRIDRSNGAPVLLLDSQEQLDHLMKEQANEVNRNGTGV